MTHLEVFYHHRASVWGVRIQGDYIVTGSMDGTISVIDVATLQIKKHFLAHENEWGSKFVLQLCKHEKSRKSRNEGLAFTGHYLFFLQKTSKIRWYKCLKKLLLFA